MKRSHWRIGSCLLGQTHSKHHCSFAGEAELVAWSGGLLFWGLGGYLVFGVSVTGCVSICLPIVLSPIPFPGVHSLAAAKSVGKVTWNDSRLWSPSRTPPVGWFLPRN